LVTYFNYDTNGRTSGQFSGWSLNGVPKKRLLR
jgi:hypothetical protein